MSCTTASHVRHIRINDRIEPVDLDPAKPIRVRWWPAAESGTGPWRVSIYSRPDVTSLQPIWQSSPVDVPTLDLDGFHPLGSSRYWLTVDDASADATPSTAVVTFGTAPAENDWKATPIWADPSTAIQHATAANPSEAVSPSEAESPSGTDQYEPVFSHLAEESSDAGDAFFQRPTIKQTEHNGLGWAFLHGVFTAPDQPVLWATLHMTAASVKLGRQFVYRAWLNNAFVGLGPTFPIGDEARTDGFDVTDLIRPGKRNAIGVIAWTLEDQRFLAQLDLGLADGSVLHFGTSAGSPIRSNDDGDGNGTDAGGNTITGEWTGIVGNGAYPDSLSTGTQYCESPAEDLDTRFYPFALSDPDATTPVAAPATQTTQTTTEAASVPAVWPAAIAKPAFAQLVPTPTDKVAVEYKPAAKATLTDNGHVILDFGRAWMGGIRYVPAALRPAAQTENTTQTENTAQTEPVPIALRIRYGEVLNADGSVKYQLSAFNTYEETWRIAAESHAATGSHAAAGSRKDLESWGLKVFRYVEIIGADDPASQAAVQAIASHPESVSAAAIVYPINNASAEFHSDNRTLNTVWNFCRNTIEAFNGPIYADSWTRERAAYEADAWLQWRSHLALDDAPSLGEYSIDYLISNRTWPTEWPLYLILAVHDGWMSTGSLDQAHREYGRLQSLLPDRYLDEASGLIVKDPGDSSVTDGDLVDWPPAERDGFTFGRVNTVINALSSQAYADMADLARALGHAEDADHFAAVAKRMREAIHARLFDDFQGAYVDGLDTGADGRPIDHAAEHASAFALAFAEVPADRIPRIGRFLAAKGMACSVYTAAVLLEGLYRAGFGEMANRLIASHEHPRSWWNMILSGAGGTSEGWDVSIKGNTTYSHPWAASPTYLLPQGMLGIRPIEPGYRVFAVRPQLAPNHEASATIPTPYGPISVAAARAKGKDGRTALTLTVPAFTTAEVTVDGATSRVEGPATVTL